MVSIVHQNRTDILDDGESGDGDILGAVGDRVKVLRRAEGKSLRDLASDLGVSASALSQLERGETGDSMQRLQVIAEHFGLTVVDLLAPRSTDQSDPLEAPAIFRSAISTVPSVGRGKGCSYQLVPVPPGVTIQPVLITLAPKGG